MFYRLILCLILFGSMPAAAAGWKDCISGAAKGTIKAGGDLCVDLSTTDLTSDIISMRACENFDVIYNSDFTGTGVLMNDLTVLTCVTNACNANACNILEDFLLTGADGSSEIYGAAASWMCVQGVTDPVNDEPRVLIRCNE